MLDMNIGACGIHGLSLESERMRKRGTQIASDRDTELVAATSSIHYYQRLLR
jgi:hypothetical protein